MTTAVLVPSRGRPNNIRELLEAWDETLSDTPRAFVQICVDADDPEVDGYRELALELSELPMRFLWGMVIQPTRLRLGGTLNRYAPALAKGHDVVGFMGDDHRPRTKGWDEKVRNHFLDTVCGVMYGNDLIQGPNLPTAVFMDAKIIRTLGWFVLPGQIHLFMDNLWKVIGEQLGTLHYDSDMIIEHVHPIAQKAAWDQTYIEANDGAVEAADQALFNVWYDGQMAADIERIRNA